MSARIIDGEAIAAEMTEALKADIEALRAAGRPLRLHAVQANDDRGSAMYVKSQRRSCEEVGIEYSLDELPVGASQDQIVEHVEGLNADPDCTGIILQMPVPDGVDARKIQSIIAAGKDVEGMNPANMGRLFYTGEGLLPCTAVGAAELVKRTGVDIEGANCTVVGHSEIVGKPIAVLMLGLNATTRVVHVFTQDLAHHTKDADILFVAAGKSAAVYRKYSSARSKWRKDPDNSPKPELPDLSPLVSADMVKPGAVVIDVAINRIPKGFGDDGAPLKNSKGKTSMVTVGDVDFEAAREVASHITPVPGGVGPMTVVMLLKNAAEAARMGG